jgi:hypothetical protein
MSGSYTDTFVPVQLTYYQSLDEIFDSDTVLDISTPKQPGIFDPTVVDQIIRSKNALLTATYQVDLRTYELTVRQSERLDSGSRSMSVCRESSHMSPASTSLRPPVRWWRTAVRMIMRWTLQSATNLD